MFQIKKEIVWEMGHRLMNHPGKCANLHGHSYKAIFTVEGDLDEETGMVLDFYYFGAVKEHIDKKYDHAFMFNSQDPIYKMLRKSNFYPEGLKLCSFPWEPTAENIAEQLWTEIVNVLVLTRGMMQNTHPDRKGCRLIEVTIYETATCCATYRHE